MSRKLSKNQEIQVVTGLLQNEVPPWSYSDCATFVKDLHDAGYKIVGRGSNDKPGTNPYYIEKEDPEVTLANLQETLESTLRHLEKAVDQKRASDRAYTKVQKTASDLREANRRLRAELESVANDVFNYSEWLDGSGVMAHPEEGDDRTHEDLINEWRAEAPVILTRKVKTDER